MSTDLVHTPAYQDWREVRRSLSAERKARRLANEIYAAQMREAVARFRAQGRPYTWIAQELGQSVGTIKRYAQAALDRMEQMKDEDAAYWDEHPEQYFAALPAPGAHAPDPGRDRYEARLDGKPPPRVGGYRRKNPRTGERSRRPGPDDVGPLPDEIIVRERCVMLAKAAQSYEFMARVLGITEQQARVYVYEALKKLDDSEMLSADLQRRLMVEQLDALIANIQPRALGRILHPDGTIEQIPPMLDHVDRMLKLLQRKAELEGLDRAPAVDIRVRLQEMAEQSGVSYEELEGIARDVAPRYKTFLPRRI